uniref:Uncharacterized protein n=1 Tax=Oryza glumipatula TaxID=40148 RepID=A0A0E0AT35_9ORYZ
MTMTIMMTSSSPHPHPRRRRPQQRRRQTTVRGRRVASGGRCKGSTWDSACTRWTLTATRPTQMISSSPLPPWTICRRGPTGVFRPGRPIRVRALPVALPVKDDGQQRAVRRAGQQHRGQGLPVQRQRWPRRRVRHQDGGAGLHAPPPGGAGAVGRRRRRREQAVRVHAVRPVS